MSRGFFHTPAVLASIAPKNIDDQLKTVLKIRISEAGEIAAFPGFLADLGIFDGLRSAFAAPVPFFRAQFRPGNTVSANLEFDILDSIEVKISELKSGYLWPKGWTHDLTLIKDSNKNDQILATYLKQKEMNENGKKVPILFDWNLEILEILPLKSLPKDHKAAAAGDL
jgi:hypothetical protein